MIVGPTNAKLSHEQERNLTPIKLKYKVAKLMGRTIDTLRLEYNDTLIRDLCAYMSI